MATTREIKKWHRTFKHIALSKALDSSLKRHTGLIKRVKQSIGTENHDQILKDIESLSLEKYIDEISAAVVEGIARCKTEKDVWSAVEVRYNTHLLVYAPSHMRLTDYIRVAPPLSKLLHARSGFYTTGCSSCSFPRCTFCIVP